MSEMLRCDNCGKLTTPQEGASGQSTCPHCGGRISSRKPTHSPSDAPALRRTAPWLISVLLHAAILLIFVFLTMVVTDVQLDEYVIVPEAVWGEDPGGAVMTRNRQELQVAPLQTEVPEQQHQSPRESTIPIDSQKIDKKIKLIGINSESMIADAFSKFTTDLSGGEAVPRSRFFGAGGNAHHIVFVVDRSGSMIVDDIFDRVRREMLISISHLRPLQDFHVILFAGGLPLENLPRKLVPANYNNKEQVAEFLITVRPQGQTHLVPAIQRAFDVLANANKLPGKLIYLLTDGEFPDNQEVLDAIRKANTGRSVLINTYLYGYRSGSATNVMKQIAAENGGRYRYIPTDE